MKKIKLERHLKIKLIISITLIGLLVLSFFFAKPIEDFLGLSPKPRKHQVGEEVVFSRDYFVSYLDVGQGNSTFVKLPDGKTMLIDGGDISYGEVVSNYLKDYGVDTIDYLIATHSDSDHIGGLSYILDNYEVKNIYRPFQVAGSGTSAETFVVYEHEDLAEIYEYLMVETSNRSKISRVTTNTFKSFVSKIYAETYTESGAVKESSVSVFYDGLIISGQNYEIEFFGPLKRDGDYNLSNFSDETAGYATVGYGVTNMNDNSAVFMLSCFDEHYFFSGDASFNSSGKGSPLGEDDLLGSLTAEEIEEISKVSVFILGHHGSKHSSSKELLELLSPRFVVVSSGHEYGHPADETLERLYEIKSLEEDYLLRTDEFGTITFSSGENGLEYSLEITETAKDITISYIELGVIFMVVLISIIFGIKPCGSKA